MSNRQLPSHFAAAVYHHPAYGRPLTVLERADLVLDSITARYGAFGTTKAEERRWRAGIRAAVIDGLLNMPVLVAEPAPDLTWLLVGYWGVVVQHRESGRIAAASWAARGPAIDEGDRVAMVERMKVRRRELMSDPACLLHWDRPARAAMVRDPAIATLVAPWIDYLRARMVALPTGPLPLSSFSSDVYSSKMAWEVLVHTGYRPERPSPGKRRGKDEAAATRAVWAASRFVQCSLRRPAEGGWKMALRQLFDRRLVRLATGPRGETPESAVYGWLAGWDVTASERELVSQRRQQFAASYPEVVHGLMGSVLTPATPKARDLYAMVDAGEPVSEWIRVRRGWPVWLEKAVRGRLHHHVSSAVGLTVVDHESYDERLCLMNAVGLLVRLGAAWGPRGGDETPMLVLLNLCHRLELDPWHAIAPMVRAPQQNRQSPWRLAWRQLARAPWRETIRLRSRLRASAINDWLRATQRWLEDGIRSFINDHCDLFGLRGDDSGGSRVVVAQCLKRMTLAQLVQFSADWHARSQGLLNAKYVQEAGRDYEEWPALFAPFGVAGARRVTYRCLTSADALREHGNIMNHCVGHNYPAACRLHGVHIVEAAVAGSPVATLALAVEVGRVTVVDHAGIGNTRVPQDVALDFAAIKVAAAQIWKDDEVAEQGRFDWASSIGFADPEFILSAWSERAATQDEEEPWWTNPECVERVAAAWRWAWPKAWRKAWDAGGDVQERRRNMCNLLGLSISPIVGDRGRNATDGKRNGA